jgi:hypothetical protein
MKEAGESVEGVALEISCPACGKTRIVEMEPGEPFAAALFGMDSRDYLFRGSFVCGCGRRVIASLQVSAIR